MIRSRVVTEFYIIHSLFHLLLVPWSCAFGRRPAHASAATAAKMADRPVQETLKEALALSATRVIDLFKEWDEDGDGEIPRHHSRPLETWPQPYP